MSELDLKRKVVAMMRKEYPEIWFYKAADQFTSGIPDIVGCASGMFFAIELKFKKNKLTRIQRHVLGKIDDAGGWAFVCYDAKEVRNCLEQITKSQGDQNGSSKGTD